MAEKGSLRRHAGMVTITAVISTTVIGIAESPGFRGFLFQTAPGYVGSALRWLGSPVEVARWHHWLLAIAVGLLGLSWILLFWTACRRRPSFRDYAQDTFFGVTWRWRWTDCGQIDEGAITPFYPECDRQLAVARPSSYDTRTSMSCACGRHGELDGGWPQVVEEVAIEIDRNTRSGNWKTPYEEKRGGQIV